MSEDSNNDDANRDEENPYGQFNERLDRLIARWRHRPSKWWLAPLEIATFCIGILTFAAVVAYTTVSYWTLDRLDKSIVVSGRSADAAAGALDESRRANNLTERNITQQSNQWRNDQRAWLTITGFKLDTELIEGKKLKAWVLIANTGRTPALHVTNRTYIDITDRRPFFNLASIQRRNPTTIFPGATGLSFYVESKPVANGNVLMFKAKTTRVFVSTLIDYEDVFGRPHWIKACASHESESLLTAFDFCPDGNEIDENER